ncbi:hypothetical protein LXL04_020367 [Taraxacum kok-saghyz]
MEVRWRRWEKGKLTVVTARMVKRVFHDDTSGVGKKLTGVTCSSIGDSSPWDVLLKGEVSGSSLTNNLPCRFKPGVIWLGCIGLLELTIRAVGVCLTRVVTKKCTFFVTTRVRQTPTARIVRSSSPIHPNHITPGLNRQGRLLVRLEPETSPFNSTSQGLLSPIELQLNWVRSQVRVSPTTYLVGLSRG